MITEESDLSGIEDLEHLCTSSQDKVHPWRICPLGKHYVRTHVIHIPPSKKHPEGQVVTRHAHCAENPSHRDGLSFDELQIIARTHFKDLIGPPKANVLIQFSRADEFDELIRGWTQYWNEIFHPKELLDPNLVKALIASESSFNPEQKTKTNNKKLGYARGLMQLTDHTVRIMANHKGELKNYFIYLSNKDANDPSGNICAGIRWLFRKRAIATEMLSHPATWDDAVAEYKGVLRGIIDQKNPDPQKVMLKFHNLYKQLLES